VRASRGTGLIQVIQKRVDSEAKRDTGEEAVER
jgi:hypothetical protein